MPRFQDKEYIRFGWPGSGMCGAVGCALRCGGMCIAVRWDVQRPGLCGVVGWVGCLLQWEVSAMRWYCSAVVCAVRWYMQCCRMCGAVGCVITVSSLTPALLLLFLSLLTPE